VNKIYSICSNPKNFEESIKKLKDFLLNSDYPNDLINSRVKYAIRKIEMNKNIVAQNKASNTTKTLFFSLRYDDFSSEIFISKLRQAFKKHYGTTVQLKT